MHSGSRPRLIWLRGPAGSVDTPTGGGPGHAVMALTDHVGDHGRGRHRRQAVALPSWASVRAGVRTPSAWGKAPPAGAAVSWISWLAVKFRCPMPRTVRRSGRVTSYSEGALRRAAAHGCCRRSAVSYGFCAGRALLADGDPGTSACWRRASPAAAPGLGSHAGTSMQRDHSSPRPMRIGRSNDL